MFGMKLGLVISASLPAAVLTCLFFSTSSAFANCDVTPSGIPEDAIAAIDPAGARYALAKSGIGIGSQYYGQFFANSGGVHQGGE